MRRKVTGNLKLVHEVYGPKHPLIPHEAFKREFADAIASNEEIDKHFNKARTPCTRAWSAGRESYVLHRQLWAGRVF